jgi:hypothetical protein
LPSKLKLVRAPLGSARSATMRVSGGPANGTRCHAMSWESSSVSAAAPSGVSAAWSMS